MLHKLCQIVTDRSLSSLLKSQKAQSRQHLYVKYRQYKKNESSKRKQIAFVDRYLFFHSPHDSKHRIPKWGLFALIIFHCVLFSPKAQINFVFCTCVNSWIGKCKNYLEQNRWNSFIKMYVLYLLNILIFLTLIRQVWISKFKMLEQHKTPENVYSFHSFILSTYLVFNWYNLIFL